MAFIRSSQSLLSRILKRKPGEGTRLALPQDQETAVCLIKGKKITYRFAYCRANESRQLGEKGQDYLSLYCPGDRLVFAVCDGVSQSYFGDVAANYLGSFLMDWFENFLPAASDEEAIGSVLGQSLQEATYNASQIVQAHPLPSDLPEMFRSVLEDKRKIGSETTFIAGRIDLPGGAFPEGRAVFAWLGDSRLRIWNEEAEITSSLKGEFATMQRWSTRRGMVGSNVHVHAGVIAGAGGIRRVLAYTDGLSSIDVNNGLLSNQELQKYIELAGDTATSDDIAVIEVLLEPWNTKV